MLQRWSTFSRRFSTASAASAAGKRPPYRAVLFASGEFAAPTVKRLCQELKSTTPALSHLELICPPDKNLRAKSAKGIV
jgi:hypothetical protein